MRVTVEIPRWSFTKYGADDTVDFWSPLPSPFNYGSVMDSVAPDGDPEDAIILGPRLPRGATVEGTPTWVVRFIDAGVADDKWVIGTPTRANHAALDAFFRVYALAKRVAYHLRGDRGITRYLGTFPASQASRIH
jgi:inorganic pyrophosphatase